MERPCSKRVREITPGELILLIINEKLSCHSCTRFQCRRITSYFRTLCNVISYLLIISSDYVRLLLF